MYVATDLLYCDFGNSPTLNAASSWARASFPACLPVLISPLPSESNPFSKILNQQYPFITTTLSLSLFSQLERYNLTTLLICVILSVVHLLVIPSRTIRTTLLICLIICLVLIITLGTLVILIATGTVQLIGFYRPLPPCFDVSSYERR